MTVYPVFFFCLVIILICSIELFVQCCTAFIITDLLYAPVCPFDFSSTLYLVLFTL